MNILIIFGSIHIFHHTLRLLEVDVSAVILVVDIKGEEDQRELPQGAVIPCHEKRSGEASQGRLDSLSTYKSIKQIL
jgi:hypothetical protein